MSGRVIGSPGSTLTTGADGRSALRQRGAAAERDTARILDRLAGEGMVVIHSLKVPGVAADVDHVLVGRKGVVLIDTKCWLPGWYVTALRRTWRFTGGLPRVFPYAGSPSLDLSVAALRGEGVRVRGAVVAAWPSKPGGRLHTVLMTYHGGYAVRHPAQAVAWAGSKVGGGPADEAMVAKVLAWGRP
ncbi:MAG: nuclease-related domain-containing protein [Actinomyces urogenitalis]|uniref:nuclease-related domain-containing protein n=1 Tax=Actinomyces urogenitalis TaxID=103621 RepID=UPI002913A691|nr:nuclease-related domain-containing protein [Actinomyces urogenitalis]MDU6150953.1 nuclease-related domain-containing protein [Actinomyces urogenitalis]